MALFNTTQELPMFQGTPHKPTLIVAANIGASSSLAIQFKVGNTFITADTFTSSFVRELNCSGMIVRFVVTGTVEYDVS